MTQHSASSKARTHNPSITSQVLYHWATALLVQGRKITRLAGWWNTLNQFELWHDKNNKMSLRRAKIRISLGSRSVWSESSFACLIWFFTSHQQSFSYKGTGLPGLNQYLARINVLAQGHNALTPARLEPVAPRSRVKNSTTEPLRSHRIFVMYSMSKLGSNLFFMWTTRTLIRLRRMAILRLICVLSSQTATFRGWFLLVAALNPPPRNRKDVKGIDPCWLIWIFENSHANCSLTRIDMTVNCHIKNPTSLKWWKLHIQLMHYF